ncbi:MAG: DUF3465 domain-containing protein [Planctomycetota bacterium]
MQGPTAGTQPGVSGGASIEAAFRERRSDEWVEAAGVVVKVLADDREGVPHQRILVRVDESGDITVLIAHNLNAAERVPVQNGDRLQFRGEYEWTEKGGTVHFTHEPEFQRRDPGGWIEFSGKRYD